MTSNNNNNNNDDASQQFCVRWNSHLGSLGAAFPQLLAGQQFVDVTLACEGHQLHCHRLVLAACSSFFESLLGESPCKHPIIILPRDIKLWEIQALVDFMYKGEVNVSQAGLTDLLKCAEILQIRGLSGNDSSVNLNTIKDNGTATTSTTTVNHNLIQNELLSTNGLVNLQQTEINIKNNTIVTESQNIQQLSNNNNNSSSKLITTTNNIIPPGIPISTLSSSSTLSNIPIISSISSGINSDVISIKSSKSLISDKNTIINQQEQDKLIINQYDNVEENNMKNNEIINQQQEIIQSQSRDKNIENNFNSDITTITSARIPSTINDDSSIIYDNCNINNLENELPSFTSVPIKREYLQKNNTKGAGCNNGGSSRGGHASVTGITPYVVRKTEPFDMSVYDESIDDTCLNDDFPLSNVVCEYDSNGLQINMETPGRRVRRSEAILRQAAECVSKGQTFQTVSDMFSIPISTIRFFMARKGILPRRKRGRTAGMTVTNGIVGGITNMRNSTIGEMNKNNNLTSINLNIEKSRSASPLEPPFQFATYKLPELKPKLS